MTTNFTAKQFDDFLMKSYGKRKLEKTDTLPLDIIAYIESKLLYNLTYRQQKCFELYYKKKYNIREISNIMNISSPTVCRHLQRARKNILNSIRNFNLSKPLWS
ncbi:MAG: sigma factor-like helix-turn-helix DNA-binding protein [Clostridia bacterium]|nr:sigma factor-like helix-turn-helix DNA-binding protein [Clostridia bacterium]